MKKFLLLIFCAVLSIATHAEKVTEQEAIQKAQQFLQGKKIKQDDSASHRLCRAPKTNVTSDAYYVFNVEDNGGFVIVSGDDRTEEILGYADKGTFDVNNLPDNLKTWLGVYETAIKSIANKPVKRSQRRIITHETIKPLLDCQWGQGTPYNAQCPIFNEQNCVTGCVATALAQLMYYHKWPESVGTIDGYQDWWRDEYLSELPSTTFNWSQMKACYTENESADEVAKLMRYCGQAVGMQYGIYESGVPVEVDYSQTLLDVFNYEKSMRKVMRNSYSGLSWQEIIYRELAEERPVLYGAFNGFSQGHVFICDGYENGYFHMNWGWNGNCDGFFLLSLLDPDRTDDPMNGYNVDQNVTIGIQKRCDMSIGEEFEDGCFRYRIIGQDKVWAFKSTDYIDETTHEMCTNYDPEKDLIMPDYVTYNNRQYKVTMVGGGSFWLNFAQWVEPWPQLILPQTLESIVGEISGGISSAIHINGSKTISIPKNVHEISAGSIYGHMDCILVDEENLWYKSEDGVLYSKDGTSIERFPCAKEVDTYHVLDGVTHIATQAFYGCHGVKNIVLPESVEGEIGAYTFCSCNFLESLNLPDGITSIGPLACSLPSLKSITLPKNLKSIAIRAFQDCISLEEITIPGSVEFISCGAFTIEPSEVSWFNEVLGLPDHSSLKRITVKSFYPIYCNDDETFSEYTYENATLYVPVGAKVLYENAQGWHKFKHIEEVDMPDANMNMQENITGMFQYKITGENTVSITGPAINLYDHVTVPPTLIINGQEYKVTAINQNAFINQEFTWLTISEGIESVGSNAFWQNCKLQRVDLPASFQKYEGNGLFFENPSLAEITLAEGNPYFTLKDGVLYTKDMTTLVAHPAMLNNKELIIPNGVTRIEPYSLSDCKYLEDVTIPNTVQEMYYAFYGFSQDVSIKSITVRRETPPEGWSMFDTPDNAIVDKATLYVPTGCRAVYQEYPDWGKFKHIEEIDMPDAVVPVNSQFLTYSITGENTVIVTGANRGLYGHVTLPTTVNIDNKEYHIAGLEESALVNQFFSWITIPEGFESIGYNAVGQNSNLTRIDLPSTIKYDGYYFIFANPSLAEITLAEGNPYFTLKDGVLYTKDMTTLVAHPAMLKGKELIIPNGVTRIEPYSLSDCKYLEDVTIPNTVQEMPCAFYGFSQDVSIKSITVQRKTPPEGWSIFDTPDNAIIDNATLYVPTGCKAVYQEHPEWGKFKHIEEKKDTPGDVNGDGKVNITDAVGIVNYLLGNPSDGFIEAAADVNNDGSITITDAVAVVNMILESGNSVRELMPLLNYEMIPE